MILGVSINPLFLCFASLHFYACCKQHVLVSLSGRWSVASWENNFYFCFHLCIWARHKTTALLVELHSTNFLKIFSLEVGLGLYICCRLVATASSSWDGDLDVRFLTTHLGDMLAGARYLDSSRAQLICYRIKSIRRLALMNLDLLSNYAVFRAHFYWKPVCSFFPPSFQTIKGWWECSYVSLSMLAVCIQQGYLQCWTYGWRISLHLNANNLSIEREVDTSWCWELRPLDLLFASFGICPVQKASCKVEVALKDLVALLTVSLNECWGPRIKYWLLRSWDPVHGQYGRPWWWRWRCSWWLHIWHQSCFHAYLSWRSVLVKTMVLNESNYEC